jgi:hypothetical protein
MKKTAILLALLTAICGDTFDARASTNSAGENRLLIIDSSSMSIGGGKATLTIGTLRRTNGFLKNEKGRLAIVVSDQSLVAVTHGKVAAITGTATTSGKGSESRPITATATPVDNNRGKLKLWFMAGDRKMIFTPTYHFSGSSTATVSAPPAATHVDGVVPIAPPANLKIVANNL